MFRISWLVTIISTAISSFDNTLNLCTKCSMSFLLIPLTFSQSTQLSLNCTTICKLKTQINYCLKLQWNMKNNKYIKLCSCIHSFVITVELFFCRAKWEIGEIWNTGRPKVCQTIFIFPAMNGTAFLKKGSILWSPLRPVVASNVS